MEIIVDEKFLETLGDNSLVGLIGTRYREIAPQHWPKVVLVFPETSIQWRQRHNGPHQYIVNEYTIGCLLRDVMQLREWNVEVEIKTMTRDPEK